MDEVAVTDVDEGFSFAVSGAGITSHSRGAFAIPSRRHANVPFAAGGSASKQSVRSPEKKNAAAKEGDVAGRITQASAEWPKVTANELVELTKAADRSPDFFLDYVYSKYPPLKPGYSKPLDGTLAMRCRLAVLHYHPDKNCTYGQNWLELCVEISKFLNGKRLEKFIDLTEV
jgi:hypothetical protein